MTLASTERRNLAELLHTVGPDAPTCCEGWTTRDLAVHLYLREHRPDAAAGMFVGPLEGRLKEISESTALEDYDSVVDDWAAGPGFPLKYADAVMNALENYVHHEDVRRAQPDWRPRTFSFSVESEMTNRFKLLGKMLLRKSQVPVIVEPDGQRRIVFADRHKVADQGDNVVRISGPISEIILWAFGRPHKDLTISGDVSKIEKSAL